MSEMNEKLLATNIAYPTLANDHSVAELYSRREELAFEAFTPDPAQYVCWAFAIEGDLRDVAPGFEGGVLVLRLDIGDRGRTFIYKTREDYEWEMFMLRYQLHKLGRAIIPLELGYEVLS